MRRAWAMTTRTTLADLDAALNLAAIGAVARCVMSLDGLSRERLAMEVGDEAADMARRAARHVRRGEPRGRVVVVPGLLGSRLGTRDASGRIQPLWWDGE